MKAIEQIDFMISALQVAKSELKYAYKYQNKGNQSRFYPVRTPNGTLIRENLKSVSRMASITAKKVTLSCYNKQIEEDSDANHNQ